MSCLVDSHADLDEAAIPLLDGDEDETPSMTALTPNNHPDEGENLTTNEEAEMSSEETISSSSFSSPNGFCDTNENSRNPNGRMSSDSKWEPENSLQVNELEEQVKALHDLLILKEKEWNVIFCLKKHTEYALEQVKRGQRIAKTQIGFDEKVPMTENDKNTWMSMITTNNIGTLKTAEQKIKNATGKLESRYITMEKAFPLGFITNTPRSSLQDRDSIGNGEKNSLVATTSKPKVPVKPKLKPAPKLPASKSPTTALQRQRSSGAVELRPFIRTLR